MKNFWFIAAAFPMLFALLSAPDAAAQDEFYRLEPWVKVNGHSYNAVKFEVQVDMRRYVDQGVKRQQATFGIIDQDGKWFPEASATFRFWEEDFAPRGQPSHHVRRIYFNPEVKGDPTREFQSSQLRYTELNSKNPGIDFEYVDGSFQVTVVGEQKEMSVGRRMAIVRPIEYVLGPEVSSPRMANQTSRTLVLDEPIEVSGSSYNVLNFEELRDFESYERGLVTHQLFLGNIKGAFPGNTIIPATHHYSAYYEGRFSNAISFRLSKNGPLYQAFPDRVVSAFGKVYKAKSFSVKTVQLEVDPARLILKPYCEVAFRGNLTEKVQ